MYKNFSVTIDVTLQILVNYFLKISCAKNKCLIKLHIGTFNSWVEPNFLKEGRREYEQEGFFNSISSNNYLPFTILAIYSINIKEIHLTQL